MKTPKSPRRWRWLLLAAAAVYAILATWSLVVAADGLSQFTGDAAEGAKLHDKDCVSCHVKRVGGDGSSMYTRSDRRVTTMDKLKAQVAYCNTELDAGYFPEDEEHVAAYLDLHYYRFGGR